MLQMFRLFGLNVGCLSTENIEWTILGKIDEDGSDESKHD